MTTSRQSWTDFPVPQRGITIERHILEYQKASKHATGALSGLLQEIATASKIINSKVNMAGLAGALGVTGAKNVQGEEVQKLDEFANATLIRCVEAGGSLCCMASEEVEELILIPEGFRTGKYLLLFDPLDGSSNIDVNISIGTIFSILRRKSTGRDGTLEDCLQCGTEQVAAGYIIYGSSTMFVYTTGHGVHGFTLDPSVGEYFLSHPIISMPDSDKIFSVNEGNSSRWEDGLRAWVESLREPSAGGALRSGRYVGTLVADFHRTLLKGGIFMYPGEKKQPQGKLRLLYEASPMAFLSEQAGGAASDGRKRILEVQPSALHQRTPLFIGSKKMVEAANRAVAS